MKIEEIKTIWRLAKSFWTGGFIFWLTETIIFLIIEGWHLKATNPIEIYCDKIVSNMWFVALNLTIASAFFMLNNLNKK